jgi:acyl carrier protein
MADLTFFEGLSLLSGFYADAAIEREVVENYVLNQQHESLTDDRSVARLRDVIDSRLHATVVSAQLRSLSSVIEEEGIDRIDLLKINVEKSELDVLLGLASHDWSRIRQLVIEVDQLQHVEPITMLLERHGFDHVVEQDPLLRRTELCYLYAIRPSAAGRLIAHEASDAHRRSLPAVDDSLLAPATLRNQLKEKLPRHMVPSAFVLLEKLPLTSNGKIDRRALPPPAHDSSPSRREFTAPQTETEKALAAIWSELLKVENIDIDEDFFDLGGHSLMAMKLVLRISDVFGVDLPLSSLFERPTISGVAAAIDALAWVAAAPSPATVTSGREYVEL